LHRSDNLTFYPFNAENRAENIGEGEGKGFNVNVAWETGVVADDINFENNKVCDLGNQEYKHAFDTLLLPLIKEFNPQLIIISCGFDSAIHDFLGWSQVSPIMYHYMTQKLKEITPKVLVV
jgi:histone deacetylase 6